MNTAAYVVLAVPVSLVAIYLASRVASYAYFRTRAEYDKRILGKMLTGDDDNAEG